MSATSITSLTPENQPKTRESAAREILGNLEVLEVVRYGSSLYAAQLKEDMNRVPNGNMTIAHALASIIRLDAGVTDVGKLPKRRDFGGYDRGNQKFGGVILGEAPTFGGKDVPNLKITCVQFDHTAYRDTRRSWNPAEAYEQTLVKRRIEVSTGMANLDAKRKEYVMDQTGLQIDLAEDGQIIAIRGLMLNGETPHVSEELPYNDSIDLSSLNEAIDAVAN